MFDYHTPRTIPFWSLLFVGLLAVGLIEGLSAAEPEPTAATVRVRIVDDESDTPVTAMVCIERLDDDTVRLPPTGNVLKRVSHVDEFYRGIEFDPNDKDWVGPVRKTMGLGDNNDRSYVYEERPSLPFWRSPVTYQVLPKFRIDLPAGRYRISVARGMEFVPIEKEFSVVEGVDASYELRLKRWVNLPKAGWYSGDVHVHHPTLTPGQRDFLLYYAEAEDLHVVNVLEMGHHRGTDFKQRGFGPSFREQRGDYALVSGQEEPRSTFGHVIGLNTTALARDLDTYDLYDLAFQRLHDQQGAVVGFAHFSWNGCSLPRGFPWYVTTEAIDFVELLQFNTINTLDYYDYLNLGFRLSAAAGSDIPWGSTIGECRTFVYTGDEFDLDAWFAGLKAGRTFVSNGPVLEFSVNEQLAGSEIEFDGSGTVTVRARAWGHPLVGSPDVLELVGNEGVLKRVERMPGADGALLIEAEIEIAESQWLAVNTRCANGAVAHSSPIYVVVDGEPTWSRDRSEQIVKKQLAAIAEIEQEFPEASNARSRAIRERLDRAKNYYVKLLTAVTSNRR